MTINRLEKKVERLKTEKEKLISENKELQKENAELKKVADRYVEKERVLDDTVAEYQRLISNVHAVQDKYKLLLKKLREYDGKIMNKYRKTVKTFGKEEGRG